MRGQAHTLEAFTATLLLVASVIFALQATAVTPLSASTSNQHIQNQHRLVANDLFATAVENGSLGEAVLYWNTTENAWAETGTESYFTSGGPHNTFGHMLNRTFRDERIAFNVYVHYWASTTNSYRYETMVYMGSPSDNAVAAFRSLTLYDGARLSAPGETANVSTAAANGNFYATDADPDGELFNVLEVRIVVWRM